jgi:hypothetical protein
MSSIKKVAGRLFWQAVAAAAVAPARRKCLQIPLQKVF